MVFRVYVEKKIGFTHEADKLFAELRNILRVEALEKIRVINRYDAEKINEKLFGTAVAQVFSEPQVDDVFYTMPSGASYAFGVEYLLGQFDQRADSAEQCIQFISQGEKPAVRTAKIYLLYGPISNADITKIKNYLINPVECREADLGEKQTLSAVCSEPAMVKTVEGFTRMPEKELGDFARQNGLALDAGDISVCQNYFKSAGREPTVTEIKLIDTYWSDHCRHTTFSTVIDKVVFDDPAIEKEYEKYLEARRRIGREKPVTLMDLATTAMRVFRAEGKLAGLDESEEINACTVKIKVDVGGEKQDWLLLFKNETHNHPTEIEPFGGAATCIGGAIRDPLSGRAYVYAAMRLTGAGNPLKPIGQTLAGKLPQRKIVTAAANGYSSYGNQIGVATGLVDEIYHDGYIAKRMEIGAVIGAVPAKNVVRMRPAPGDQVILLGGKTGRDGCGGATGSSKSHTADSLAVCGAEVQKGNAPEERKIQRFFRNGQAAALIKRCNDFGAGGVSVAVGELADGVEIRLDDIPKKYEGLNGTELAISESQERMAVVVSAENAAKFIELARQENLDATPIATVTEEPRLVMWWKGQKIADLERSFLNSNGAEKHVSAQVEAPQKFDKNIPADFQKGFEALAEDLNICSKRGLAERFDSTIGAGTVLMPLGGKYQSTPIQAMAHKISVEKESTGTCSLMSWGFNPFISEKSPFHGAYLAVVESVSKLAAAGALTDEAYLTFQEYYEKLGKDGKKWGKPLAALLGANKAQFELGVASIGGKDSMSGTFEELNVPPTLVSFAVAVDKAENIIPPEFKKAGSKVVRLSPERDAAGLPAGESLKKNFALVNSLIKSGKAISAYTTTQGGAAECVLKMCMGNGLGFAFSDAVCLSEIFGYDYGAFVLELAGDEQIGVELGRVTEERALSWRGKKLDLIYFEKKYNQKLESIFPTKTANSYKPVEKITYKSFGKKNSQSKFVAPRVLIPVFPGTNCEYDAAKAFISAGAQTEIFVITNLTAKGITESLTAFAEKIKNSQIVFLPGGFSGGDEPDGSAKFITAFMRNPLVADAVHEFLKTRGGLMCGVCNGFQALVKLGLVPFGEIVPPSKDLPTLALSDIARHQSRIVRVRVASNMSPWLRHTEAGQVFSVPISHAEGKFVASESVLAQMRQNGQIATQYAGIDGQPTMDIDFNPNGSVWAIEGITSPDGRVFGKMGHSERTGAGLYKNVPGNYDMGIMLSAVEYFK